MKLLFTLITTLVFTGTVQAANFTLEAANAEPLYQTTLTKAVYEQSRLDNLNDLAITNANGESVPYALLPYQKVHLQTKVTGKSKPLVIFPMQKNAIDSAGGLNIQLNHREHNTSVNVTSVDAKTIPKTYYLFDLGEKHPAFKKLSIDWQGQEGSLLTVKVITSNNLKDWSTAGQGALLKVSAGGKNITQNSITLDKVIKARYLQIQALDTADTFKLTSVNIEFNQTEDLIQPTLWQEISFSNREQDNTETHIDFESASRLPTTSLNISLPQINTITQVTVLARNHQEKPWRRITKASLYRLNKQGKDYANQNIRIRATTARYWRLSFNQAKGGIGKDNPQLSLGWLPDVLVWNARGSGPFNLLVGENNNQINIVPVTNLLNPYEAKKVRQLPKATISAPPQEANLNAWDSPVDYKYFLLWGGLFLGVLALAAMAYSLLKSNSKT